jgi:hypothetical protein
VRDGICIPVLEFAAGDVETDAGVIDGQ